VQFARLDQGDVQEVIDRLQHEFQLFSGEYRGRLFAQEFAVGKDMADRAPHVVRCHTGKLSLEPVEAFEFDVCRGELNRPFGDQFVQGNKCSWKVALEASTTAIERVRFGNAADSCHRVPLCA
jgi:hypothetical protein